MTRLASVWLFVLALCSACGDDDPGRADAGADAGALAACSLEPAAAGDPVTAVSVWRHESAQVGIPQGSVALCDLDHDGRLEVIAPIAPPAPNSGVVAVLDADTGALRWQTPPSAPAYAYPYCVDVDADGIDDVLLAGRIGDVVAYGGDDGAARWTLGQGDPSFFPGNTSAVVSEASDATVLFVAKGGGGNGDDIADVPGWLIAFDTVGTILATWDEPDAAEIYSTPAVARGPDSELLVAIGSGGERLGGGLYLLEFDEATPAFSVRARVPTPCNDGGFVGSPVFGDVTGDGVPELVGIDYCGTAHVVDVSGSVLWTYPTDVLYGTANPLLADLTGDGALDVVVAFESFNFSYPVETSTNARSEVVALDGPSGTELWRHETDKWMFASPVSADFDGDGVEDVLIAVPGQFLQKAPELIVLSGVDGAVLYSAERGETIGTPVIGDVDDDGNIDVLLAHMEPGADTSDIVRLEFCGRPFVSGASESGFRGYPVHDGSRR